MAIMRSNNAVSSGKSLILQTMFMHLAIIQEYQGISLLITLCMMDCEIIQIS
jgi:hypothetical protein